MKRKMYLGLLLLILLVATTESKLASAKPVVLNPEESLERDAEEYAATYGVDVKEAIRRLRLQHHAAELNAKLLEKEHDKFAGIFIQHTPKFRVIVQFTENAKSKLKPHIENGPLANDAEARLANISLAELEIAQENITTQLSTLGVDISSSLDIAGNRIDLVVADLAAFNAVLEANEIVLPSYFTASEGNPTPDDSINIYAGLPLELCTTGYIVYNPGYTTKYGTTSGHCPNPPYQLHIHPYTPDETWYPFVAEYWSGNNDFQLHTVLGTPKPWAADSIDWDGTPYYRLITSSQLRANQTPGQFICHHGKASGFSCGTITTNSACYTTNGWIGCQWVRVYGCADLNGDSGGPWYNNSVAYGIHRGHDTGNSECIYMAVDRLQAAGYYVWHGAP